MEGTKGGIWGVLRQERRERLRQGVLRLLALPRHLNRHHTHPASPNRILFIKPDHLGDVLFATPALRLLRHCLPNARVTAIVGPWARVILANNPHLDTILTLPFPGFDRHASQRAMWYPYALLLRYAALLRQGEFDTALIGRDDHWWGAMLALYAGIPRRIGFDVPLCAPFLTTALPWNAHDHVAQQAIAMANVVNAMAGQGEHKDTVDSADSNASRWPLLFHPSPADKQWAQTWLQSRGIAVGEKHHDTSPPLLVIHPGTGGMTKHWIAERWAAVANILAARFGMRVVVTGGPGEEQLVAAVAAAATAAISDPAPLTIANEMTIGQMAALFGHAAVVLGVDSGPLHIAVSQQTPTVHLFGPSDMQRFGPWGDHHRHRPVRAGEWCSPCHTFSHCHRGLSPPPCMDTISVAQVVEAAGKIIEI
jgi:heptosyltransferase-2/heptosyltransferase-3